LDKEIILRRDIVRVPRRFIDYQMGQSLPVPVIVAERKPNNHGFGSYWIRRDDPNIAATVTAAEWWIAPDGPFRQGNIVKAARYFLKAIKANNAAELRSKLKGI
jgi:hypothetical protein